MARRAFSEEELYAFMASDTESATEDEDDPTFLLSSSSSSSSSDDDEPPRRRRRRQAEPRTPHASDPVAHTSASSPGARTSVEVHQTGAPEPPAGELVWTPPEGFEPVIPDFVGESGIKINVTGFTEIDFFSHFFSDSFVNLMVEQTNLYAQQFVARHPGSFLARPGGWTPVNAAEMRTFWGLVLHMGLVKKPSVRHYWSGDILYHSPLFSNAMTRPRFEAIRKCLHYADNAASPPQDDPAYDRLYKVRPVIDHFGAKFAEAYVPGREVAVDESLIAFRGRLAFRQYIPSKRARYGVKVYKICESTSGYTYRFRVYEGRDSRLEPPECPGTLGVSGKIAWDLMFPLLDKGYHLYVDNFYTSIPLYRSLAARSTLACGTVRKNQRGLPAYPLQVPLPRGESRALTCGNLLLVRYKDKRDVLMLTTIHGNGTTPVPVRGSTATVLKPDCIVDYNRYMGGVDLSDQVLTPYNAMRKTRAWYKKVAVYLVQVALYNSFVLFRSAGNTGTFLQFYEAVLMALIFSDRERAGRSTSGIGGPRIVPGQHFPGVVPHTGKKGRSQKKCRVCRRRGIRKDVTTQCDTCPDNPGLCLGPCFREYHTSMEY